MHPLEMTAECVLLLTEMLAVPDQTMPIISIAYWENPFKNNYRLKFPYYACVLLGNSTCKKHKISEIIFYFVQSPVAKKMSAATTVYTQRVFIRSYGTVRTLITLVNFIT